MNTFLKVLTLAAAGALAQQAHAQMPPTGLYKATDLGRIVSVEVKSIPASNKTIAIMKVSYNQDTITFRGELDFYKNYFANMRAVLPIYLGPGKNLYCPASARAELFWSEADGLNIQASVPLKIYNDESTPTDPSCDKMLSGEIIYSDKALRP